MASIEVYAFEDEAGAEQGFTTQDPDEARAFASKYHYRWIAHTYEWADSELVEDYTE